MYLKSIELQGFKSFPTKTKIAFEEGISCIVGPNGSGKSNISDALRWVLGEQSARSLRGNKQEDVIFGGSKKRKPLGMAEVTLTLDNSDALINRPFTEIAVTRRTMRGGGSEYLINNQLCRLKDITELFLDTGVGVDGVSLISQGRINEWMSARPEERRVLVEEAAGIVKYRNRKLEAVRKLAETERHLERVGDIIGELSGRIEPLRLQKEQAEQYLRLREEADACAITLAVRTLTEFTDKLTEQNQKIEQVGADLLVADTQRLSLSAEREQWKLMVSQIDEEVGRLAQDYYALQGRKEKAESQRAVVAGNIANQQANQARFQEELTALETEEAAKQQEAQQLAAHAQETEAEVKELAQVIAAGEGGAQSRREAVAYLEDALDQAKNAAFEQANQLAQKRNALHYQQQLWEKNSASAQRLQEQDQQLTEVLTEAARQQQDLAAQKQALQQQAAAARENLAAQQQAVKEQNEAVGELAAAETEARYRAHALQVRLNMLEEMRKSYEGFFPGVRALLTAKAKGEAKLNGIVDVAANLLDVPERYQQAVETYLGASLQNIVSRTQEAARTAIAYLKEKDLGRATFLPLDTLKVRQKADISAVRGLKGFCGLASELVQCAKEILPARDFLLNQVVIVEDMEAAVAAAKALAYRHSVVTLDGDMVNPGGSLSGGSRNKKSGDLLGKRRQLEEAQTEHDRLSKQLAEQEQALAAARAQLQELNLLAEEQGQELQRLSNRQYALENEAETLTAQQKTLERQQQALLQEIGELRDEAIVIEEEQAQILEELGAAELAEKELSAQVAQLSEQLTGKQAELSTEREDMTRQRVELAAREQKLVGQQKSLERIRAEIESLHWDQEAKAADLAEAEKELTAQKAALELAEQEQTDLTEQLLAAEEQLNSKRHGHSAETARLSELEKAEKEAGSRAEQLREQLHQLEVRKARMESDCQNEQNKLEEQFSLTLAEARLKPQLEGSRTALVTRLNQLKREMHTLGTVNLAAIEEYAEVDERYRFLIEQRTDLLAARAQLDQVIAEMDRIMSSRFKNAYLRLSEEFGIAFRRLFAGGAAELILTEPDNILETGVEISVSPPGKKIANYNLLSGGEKALVGIALMFAVLAVRPSPFCVMDEVDAALDEANIDRFTDYVRELAQHGQFVLISHRQGTMEAADTLWGVTMEEEGVSKLISVRLNQGQGIA